MLSKAVTMCGISGFIGGDWRDPAETAVILQRMGASLRHRGPDHSAVWIEPEARVAFAHNRLAVLDLSPAGSQPMHSRSGRFVIVFNGEIYNHLSIRDELASSSGGIAWRGHSDIETLLETIAHWGVDVALERSTGMFAFALWDKAERTLTLARDRLGEKPLFYGCHGSEGAFLFASELKALAAHPAFTSEVDRQALMLLVRYGYIPAPFSIYRGIAKLSPGTFLTLRDGASSPEVREYWSGANAAEAGVADPLGLDDGDAVEALEQLLRSAIGRQMIADVPLGAFLSGGIDSSAVVAIMQQLSARPVKTFTIGFRERGFDEAGHASAVARHLGTDHTELYVTAAEAREVVPRLPFIYDEPFADSSQIPTHLIAALARRQVTVALTGDGADELFGGYDRYLLTDRLWRRMSAVPRPLRGAAAWGLKAVSQKALDAPGRRADPPSAHGRRSWRLADKLHKGADLLRLGSEDELYGAMLSLWHDPASIVPGTPEPPTQATGTAPELRGLGMIERMMALDTVGYLPGDILAKVDRAAMAVSLETRAPFLDHRLAEFAWRLPFEQKIRGRETKWILRRVLDRYVPRELVDRPKMGFGVPIGSWLRGPLRDWAEALLDVQRLDGEGYFLSEPIRRLWERHSRGLANEQYRLWPVLMFQSWLEAKDAARDSTAACAAAVAG